jgi:DNA modification methylase
MVSPTYTIHNGNSLEVLKTFEENSIDSIVCDPPYELGFMNKKWDSSGIAYNVELWKECLRVLKPGGHLLAFSGSRTYHRMTVAIEDAGFEIRDQIMWVYGSGFPKSLDISKAIDKKPKANKVKEWKKWLDEEIKKCPKNKKQINEECGFTATSYTKTDGKDHWSTNLPKNGKWKIMKDVIGITTEIWDWIEDDNIEERGVIESTGGLSGGSGITFGNFTGKQLSNNPISKDAQEWQGWGTALKPAHEPICLARKPLIGTVAENVLEWGVGGINIDGCRIETIDDLNGGAYAKEGNRKESQSLNSKGMNAPGKTVGHDFIQPLGRFPANFIHDGSDEIIEGFPYSTSKGGQLSIGAFRNGDVYGKGKDVREPGDPGYGDSGSAARFFYCAKASKKDRDEGLDGFALGDPPASARRKPAEGRENALGLPRANHHPTVKPTSLMQYLCRLVTPPNGIVLDPFMGSGSTGKATMYEGFRFIGIDLDPEYCKIAKSRIEFALNKANKKEEKKEKKTKDSKEKSLNNRDNSTLPLW